MKKKIDKDELVKKGGKTFSEFKEFISKGNVIDLAIGVIIGAAFGKIVSSIVDDILMPLIGVLIGGVSFSDLSFKVGDAVITYGNFIQNVIDFLIIAACVFFLIKTIERFTNKIKKTDEVIEKTVDEVKKDESIQLLEEIRDILKDKKED